MKTATRRAPSAPVKRVSAPVKLRVESPGSWARAWLAVMGGKQLLLERLHHRRFGVFLMVQAEQVQDPMHEQAGRARPRRPRRARVPAARPPPGR